MQKKKKVYVQSVNVFPLLFISEWGINMFLWQCYIRPVKAIKSKEKKRQSEEFDDPTERKYFLQHAIAKVGLCLYHVAKWGNY